MDHLNHIIDGFIVLDYSPFLDPIVLFQLYASEYLRKWTSLAL